MRNHAPTQYTFAGDHIAQPSGLCDHCPGCLQTFAQLQRSAKRKLFIHHRRHPDLTGRFQAAAFEIGNCIHHACQASFGITGSAAIHTVVRDSGLKRIDGHALNRHGIHMSFEDQTSIGPCARQASDDIVASWQNVLSPGLQSRAVKIAFHKVRNLGFARATFVKRIHRVNANQVSQQRRKRHTLSQVK